MDQEKEIIATYFTQMQNLHITAPQLTHHSQKMKKLLFNDKQTPSLCLCVFASNRASESHYV